MRLLFRAGRAVHNPFDVRPYVRPKLGDSARDFGRVAGDMRKVGSDLRRVAKKELTQHGR
jgi:hypothetical protein